MYKAKNSRYARLQGISNKLCQDYWREDLRLYPISKNWRKKCMSFNVIARLKKILK